MQYRAPAHWLLDLEVHGRVFRYADAPVTVPTLDGDTLVYREGLPALTLPLVEEGTVGRSVQLQIVDDTDWPLLESRGQSPHRSRGVLRWWREGQSLEDARVVLRGVALVPRVGIKGEGIQVTLTREPRATPARIPPVTAVATDDTWPVRSGGFFLADNVRGQSYPIVIGYPGDGRDGNPVTFPTPVVPALMVEWTPVAGDGLLLSLGHLELVGTVRLINATTGDEFSTANVVHSVDNLGRAVTMAYRQNMGSPNDAYYAGYERTFTGGILSPYSDGALRKAGEVIRWALSQSSRDIDHARIRSYASLLDAYMIDSYINRPIDPLQWLDSAILAWLPVIIVEGRRGLYVRPIRYDLTAQDAVAHLVESGNVERVGGLVRLDDEPANEVTVRYRRGRDGGYLDQITLTAQQGRLSGDVDAGVSTDDRIYASSLAARSQDHYGQVFPETVTLDHTWDRETAILVAQQTIERRAIPRRSVSYEGGSELNTLEPGDAVLVTDADLYLSEAVAIVGEITLSVEAAVVTLILLDERVI